MVAGAFALVLPLAAAAAPVPLFEVLAYSKSVVGGSATGDENPFWVDFDLDPPLPPFGSSTQENGDVVLDFRLNDAADVSLLGDLTVVTDGYGSAGAAISLQTLDGSEVWVDLVVESDPGAPCLPLPCTVAVDFAELLGPGDYRLVASGSAYSIDDLITFPFPQTIQGTGQAIADVSMEWGAAPEPSLASLWASGVLTLTSLARRRRRLRGGDPAHT